SLSAISPNATWGGGNAASFLFGCPIWRRWKDSDLRDAFRRPAVFKTAAINRSATPPSWDLRPPPDTGAVSSMPAPVRQAGSRRLIHTARGRDLGRPDLLGSTQVRPQHPGNLHASVFPLVLLEDGH